MDIWDIWTFVQKKKSQNLQRLVGLIPLPSHTSAYKDLAVVNYTEVSSLPLLPLQILKDYIEYIILIFMIFIDMNIDNVPYIILKYTLLINILLIWLAFVSKCYFIQFVLDLNSIDILFSLLPSPLLSYLCHLGSDFANGVLLFGMKWNQLDKQRCWFHDNLSEMNCVQHYTSVGLHRIRIYNYTSHKQIHLETNPNDS